MDVTEIIQSFNGFLWEAIYEIKPDDYIEPEPEIGIAEVVLGPMTELEKALFSIRNSLFFSLLPFFNIGEDSMDKITDFYEWIISSPQVNFLDKYSKSHPDEEKMPIDDEVVLILRTNFLAAYDFLEVVTSQRFNFHPEDVFVNYRKGFVVTIIDCKLLNAMEN